jgi:hypothetical protein
MTDSSRGRRPYVVSPDLAASIGCRSAAEKPASRWPIHLPPASGPVLVMPGAFVGRNDVYGSRYRARPLLSVARGCRGRDRRAWAYNLSLHMHHAANRWGGRFELHLGLGLLFIVGCGGQSSANPDAASSVGSDGSDAAAAGADANRPGVTCGAQTCNHPAAICCVENLSEAGPMYVSLGLVCEATCPRGSGSFACMGPANCSPGQSCCAPTGGLFDAQCTDSACLGMQFCQTKADCPLGDECVAFPPSGMPGLNITAGLCGPPDASFAGD